MPAPSRGEKERLDRLAGSGKGSGGALPLPDLFSAMLNEVLDGAPVSDERMTGITSSVLSFKTEQVRTTWATWEALTADVLTQMESRELIERKDDSWVRGPKLATGQRLEVIPARKGKGSKSDGVTVWTREEREARSRAAHRAGEATELAATLRPGNRGLRPVDQGQVREIQESLPEVGQIYPILVDQEGRILDGKHRYAANPEWKRHTIKVDSDEMALAIALRANKGAPLPSRVTAKIESLILGAKTAQEKQRERIESELLSQSDKGKPLSHRAVARRLGLDHSRDVDRACSDLVSNAQLAHCPHRFTEDGKEAPGPKPKMPTATEEQVKELLLENPQRSNAQIQDEAGLTPNQHRVVERERERLEAEGAIPVITAREGRDGTVRHLPGANGQSPAAAPQPNHGDAMRSARRPRPNKLAQRIARLLSLWDKEDDDPSELEELEALRRDIDERIATLRG
jgi:hypothetical protein